MNTRVLRVLLGLLTILFAFISWDFPEHILTREEDVIVEEVPTMLDLDMEQAQKDAVSANFPDLKNTIDYSRKETLNTDLPEYEPVLLSKLRESIARVEVVLGRNQQTPPSKQQYELKYEVNGRFYHVALESEQKFLERVRENRQIAKRVDFFPDELRYNRERSNLEKATIKLGEMLYEPGSKPLAQLKETVPNMNDQELVDKYNSHLESNKKIPNGAYNKAMHDAEPKTVLDLSSIFPSDSTQVKHGFIIALCIIFCEVLVRITELKKYTFYTSILPFVICLIAFIFSGYGDFGFSLYTTLVLSLAYFVTCWVDKLHHGP